MEAYSSAAEAARESASSRAGSPGADRSSPPRARAGGGPRRRRGEWRCRGPSRRARPSRARGRARARGRRARRGRRRGRRRWASRRRRRRSRRDLRDLDERLARARVAHEGGGAAVAKAHLRGGIGGKALLHREPRDELARGSLVYASGRGGRRDGRARRHGRAAARGSETRGRAGTSDAHRRAGTTRDAVVTDANEVALIAGECARGARTRPRLSPTPARIVRARGWKISPPAFFNDYWHCYIILTFSHTTIP